MARRKMHHAEHEEEGGHGDRPWVWFMIDSFFLVTQFFVITFKVRSDEVLLPQRLPPGGTSPASVAKLDNKQKLSVHVTRESGNPVYEYQQNKFSFSEFVSKLSDTVGGGKECQVRVSYDPNVPFSDVIAIFNACAKLRIEECGLIPLRTTDAKG